MKRSFILDNEKKAVTSASDKNLGNFYFHFLNGGQVQTKKEVLQQSENSDMFLSDEQDEKRSFTPQPRPDSMLVNGNKLSTLNGQH